MYVYYQKYCNFAGLAQKSMSVETAILFKIIVICLCLSVYPSVCLSVRPSVRPSLRLSVHLSVCRLILTSHNETAGFLVTLFCSHDDFIKPSDD